MRKNIQARRLPVALFLIISLLQGSYFITCIGPLTIPDADMHANTAYAIATGQALRLPKQQKDRFGNTIRTQSISGDARLLSLKGLANELVYTILTSPNRVDPNLTKQRSVNDLPKTIVTVPNDLRGNRSNQYHPLLYLPQALGARIALQTHASPFNVWQASRISNFLLFLLMFSFAIFLIPRANYLFTLIGILPPTIFIASSLMADALFISISAIFIAFFFKLVEQQKAASKQQITVLTLLVVLLFYCKLIYVSMGILVLFLPRTILSLKRKLLFFVSSATIALSTYGIWNYLYAGLLANANISRNLIWLLHNPVKSLLLIVWNITHLPDQFLSQPPQLLAISILISLAVGTIVSFLYSRRIHDKKSSSKSTYRYVIASVFIVFLCMYLIMLSLCITWNQLPLPSLKAPIQGFQGRYLLPLLPTLSSVAFTVNMQ